MRWLCAVILASLAIGSADAARGPAEARLQQAAKPWVERFTSERLLGGFGTGRGKVHMDVLVSEAEYRAIAARRGWGRPPPIIALGFSPGVTGQALPANVRPMVRIFAHSDRALGITNQALLGGRIVLRGGCLYVSGRNQPDRLAYFPREFGLALDRSGQLVIRSRLPGGKIVGRVGDDFSWGGPIGITETAPMVRELRARCGTAPIEHVGMLVTTREFKRRYGV